jgi:Uma2 family endonuclease
LIISVASTLQLADNVLVEPDIVVVPRSAYEADPSGYARPKPESIRVIVEIAASSLRYDRDFKARVYARHGIREFWVIDANERITWMHTGPSGETWSSITERGPNDMLTTPALPAFSIRLGDIE